MKFSRRDTLVLAAAASAFSLTGLGAAQAQENVTIDPAALANVKGFTDHPIGADDAKVTVIEYASPTCPHCAEFHNHTYEGFKTAYIDNGKVKFLLRPFTRNVLDAVIFLLAEAAGETNFHNVIATYFKTQENWIQAQDPKAALLEVAKQLGFTEETFNAALANEDLFKGLEEARDQALNEFKLTGTPAFYINGKMLSGAQSLEQLAEVIDPLLV